LQDAETIEHSVWECPSANDVWGESTIKLQKCQKGWGDFQQIFLEVAKRCDQTEVELFAVIARKIWLRRNQVVHGGSFSHPNQVLREAMSILEEFRLSNANCNMPQPSSPPTLVEKWRPPPMNFVKINWDAAVDISKKIIGMGIIARDEKGRFLAAISKKQKITVEPVVAETIATINAIIFCQELNYISERYL
jgi:hypothetical protein